MAIPETKVRSTGPRNLILVLAGVIVAGIAVDRFWLRTDLVEVVAIPREPNATASLPGPVAVPTDAARAVTGPGAVASVAPVAASPPATTGERPRFDVVRVGPEGHAVIAGKAQPGAEVIVRDGSTEVARTQADGSGAFVALPTEPLKPGGRELTLAARSGATAEVKGDGAVVLVVPEVSKPVLPPTAKPAAPQAVVAVVVPNAAAPHLLQEGPTGNGDARPGLTLDRIDYDDKSAIRFTGGGAPGTTVRVYVDNAAAGDGVVDTNGRWSLVPSADVPAGMHSVRVDVLGEGGRVVGRVELPFQRSVVSASEIAGAGGRVVVQPGQSLWRLARSAYGRGVQYTVIYLANRDQIRDPGLIYPGQAFAVPKASPVVP